MKKTGWITNSISTTKWLSDSSVWLLAIFAVFFAIYANLVSKANDGSLMGSSLLYLIAISSMLWSKRRTLNLKCGQFGTLIGLIVLFLVLLKSAFMQGYDPFLRVMPLLSGIGLCFLASGIFGLNQYLQELVILSFLVPPPSVIARVIDSTLLTAKFSTALLWYTGFDVTREGLFILTPNGGVEVYAGCSGIDTMLHLLGLSVLFLMLFPTARVQKAMLPIFSLLVAFVVNGIRVSIMAILSTPTTKSSFEYWHKGDGSLLFSLLGVAVLGVYCFFVSGQSDIYSETPELGELEE
ncbi:MAG: cyanoexosortase A [Cyanobacteria bacterium J06555_13]